jgi:hypothetical protein
MNPPIERPELGEIVIDATVEVASPGFLWYSVPQT